VKTQKGMRVVAVKWHGEFYYKVGEPVDDPTVCPVCGGQMSVEDEDEDSRRCNVYSCPIRLMPVKGGKYQAMTRRCECDGKGCRCRKPATIFSNEWGAGFYYCEKCGDHPMYIPDTDTAYCGRWTRGGTWDPVAKRPIKPARATRVVRLIVEIRKRPVFTTETDDGFIHITREESPNEAWFRFGEGAFQKVDDDLLGDEILAEVEKMRSNGQNKVKKA